jgi:hypothetical protein
MPFTDAILDGRIDELVSGPKCRQMCAKVHPWLSDEIDKCLDLLASASVDSSKRPSSTP